MTDSTFIAKKRQVRITRAKATIRRADDYLRNHAGAQAAGLIRDLREMLNEVMSELEFPTGTGDDNG